eukprot:6197904-Pleurochrysis_carterae.AAC.4
MGVFRSGWSRERLRNGLAFRSAGERNALLRGLHGLWLVLLTSGRLLLTFEAAPHQTLGGLCMPFSASLSVGGSKRLRLASRGVQCGEGWGSRCQVVADGCHQKRMTSGCALGSCNL